MFDKTMVRGLLGVALIFSVFAVARGQDVIANSVADFSSTQGANGWYYGYYSGSLTSSTFQQLPNYEAPPASPYSPSGVWYSTWVVGEVWPQLWNDGGAPRGSSDNTGVGSEWPVRRWQSDIAGPITISGSLAQLNGGDPVGNGMGILVLENGNQLFSENVTSANETTYSLSTVVSIGTDLDFAITPDNNNFDYNGNTMFTAVITATPTPEPSTLALLFAGAVGVLAYAWRKTLPRKA